MLLKKHIDTLNAVTKILYFDKLTPKIVKKKIIFEVNISRFKGRDFVKGYVRELLYDGRTGRNTAESIFANSLTRFYADKVNFDLVDLSTEEIKRYVDERRKKCAYGLCLIASDRRTLKFYEELQGWGCDLFYPSSRNLANALIVSPVSDADLSGFEEFVFLDTPSDFNIAALSGKKVYVNREICGYKMLECLDTARDSLLSIFAALRQEVNSLNGESAEELAFACDALGFDKREFIFALRVFEELGLVAFKEGRLTVYRGVKADLKDSSIYQKVKLLQDEA